MQRMILGSICLTALLAACGDNSSTPAPDAAAPKATPEVVETPAVQPPTVKANPPIPQPAPVQVAPADRDKDGIADADDACPDSAPGTVVDAQGCRPRLMDERTFNPAITFAPASATLDNDAASDSLEEIFELAETYPETTVRVLAFTDSSGSAALNKRLSESRAQAVADVIAARLGAERVSSEGRGAAEPIADNTTAEGRALNRRIVVIVEPAS